MYKRQLNHQPSGELDRIIPSLDLVGILEWGEGPMVDETRGRAFLGFSKLTPWTEGPQAGGLCLCPGRDLLPIRENGLFAHVLGWT